MNIATKPATYRARTHWYVSHCNNGVIHLFRTKRDALAFAKQFPHSSSYLSVDWFDAKAAPSFAISSTAHFVDHR